MGNHRGYEIAKLIKKYNCQRIAEIGVEAGRCLKKVLQYEEVRKIVTEYWGIDPYMPLPHYLKIKARHFGAVGRRTEEQWKRMYIHTLRFTLFYPQLRIVKLTSKEAASLFENSTRYISKRYFDLVFIDAEHSYEGVKQDIQLWSPLLRSGGILCGHDYHGEYGARYPGVKEAVDELLGEDNIEQLPDCVWLRKVKT